MDPNVGKSPERVVDLKATTVESILEVTSDLMYAADLDALLEKIVKTVSETFGMRTVSIGIVDRETGDYAVRATYGYAPEVDKEIRKVRYSSERMIHDLKEEFRIGKNTYYVPADSYEIESEDDMLFVLHPERMNRARASPEEWHELDYIDFLLYNRDGSMLGYLEIDEPDDCRVPDDEKLRAIEVFSDLAAIAIQNAALYEHFERDNRNIELLLDIIGHDVNNYAQAVSGFIELGMQRKNIPEPSRKSFSKALDQVWNINKLVNNVKLFAKIEVGGSKDLKPMDLLEVVRDGFAGAESNYNDRAAKLSLKDDGATKRCMMNDLAKEIFVNIFSNAIKFDQHPEVDIEVEVKAEDRDGRGFWSVSVVDRGPGIDDSQKDWIFERFTQAGAPCARGSSGLGLHIAKRLVDSYKGRIWVENRVRGDRTQGSRFVVILPRSE
ncbi:MAG TPA: GAF domain-containing sensor histidine kinase [Thermoplasmata archaeon]